LPKGTGFMPLRFRSAQVGQRLMSALPTSGSSAGAPPRSHFSQTRARNAGRARHSAAHALVRARRGVSASSGAARKTHIITSAGSSNLKSVSSRRRRKILFAITGEGTPQPAARSEREVTVERAQARSG
jgi:hypothetical protein